MQTIKFFTLGCKVNQYDTQLMREQFLNSGFKELNNHLPSDIYLINTCTVTQNADSQSLNLIRRAKKENPKAEIIVTGCLAELDEDKIKKIGKINLIVRNKDKERIFALLRRNELNGLNETTSQTSQTHSGITYFKAHTRAFLKIQDGCDNFCSYCKVPLVKGRSRSRDLAQIIQEASSLVQNGFQEIVLCGICLGAYGRDLKPKIHLVNVIAEFEKIAGLLRLRLSSIEAGDITDELIDKMAVSKKLCRHLHIPMQSGDDWVLKRMNRNYQSRDYLNLIKKIRKNVPLIAITTDVLVGFPGETEENFQNTVTLIKEILPLKVHIFPYSKREGTAANNFADKINPQEIKKRITYLRNIAEDCALKYKRKFLNKALDVLIEGRLRVNPDFWEGYTDNYIKVLVKSKLNLKNKLIRVRIFP